ELYGATPADARERPGRLGLAVPGPTRLGAAGPAPSRVRPVAGAAPPGGRLLPVLGPAPTNPLDVVIEIGPLGSGGDIPRREAVEAAVTARLKAIGATGIRVRSVDTIDTPDAVTRHLAQAGDALHVVAYADDKHIHIESQIDRVDTGG